MGADFWIVLRWWGTLFLVGAVAFPLTKALFTGRWIPGPFGKTQGKQARDDNETGWWDQGYFFSKAVGMAVVTWIVFVFGMLHAIPFSVWSITISLIVLFLLGLIVNLRNDELGIRNYGRKGIREKKYWKQGSILFLEELFFLIALLFWSWVKGHEPSIRGLEKFMDFGFMQSILKAQFFPPADMWYAGLPINYYYFGHMVVAVLTKLSGLDLAYTFNLMLATIFALTLTMSFSIGVQLVRIGRIGSPRRIFGEAGQIGRISQIGAGLLTAFLVTMAGNLQTLYAFTRGYTGDSVKPFWDLLWNIPPTMGVHELWGKLGEGMNTYWYANATRFIPYTIHEFPSYSFVVSDVHGHVLSIPFILLAIALLVVLFDFFQQRETNHELGIRNYALKIGFYAFLVGVLLMTNALDGPIYFGLFLVLFILHNSKFLLREKKEWVTFGLTIAVVTLIAGLTSLPFLVHFKSFVTGLAVNCPPAFLANTKFGPLLFEGVEKCQVSPLWMWLLLWGFFVYCGGWFVATKFKFFRNHEMSTKMTQIEFLLIVFFVFSLALVIFPEFFYFKDIYPMHFRSNTMFKLGYEAFILFSIVSGYTIVSMIFGNSSPHAEKSEIPFASWRTKFKILNTKRLFFLFLFPLLFLVSIYPIFSVRSYFNGLKNYEGLYGFNWMVREYQDDWQAIEWLREETSNKRQETCENFFLFRVSCPMSHDVIVEADGDSYTDYARISAFTGIPTIIGWPVHEWLWRGTYDVVAPRREEVRTIYESEDIDETKKILAAYGVRYIVVGKLEREKYKNLAEWKFGELGREVFRSGGTVIYDVGVQ